MLGNKIFSFFKAAVKVTVTISVVLFLVNRPASSVSLSSREDYYAQPQSTFSKVLDSWALLRAGLFSAWTSPLPFP